MKTHIQKPYKVGDYGKKRYVQGTAWKVSVIGVILVSIFPHSDWAGRDTLYLFVFSPNAGKYGPEYSKYRDFLRSENSKWHKKLTSWYPGTFIFLQCSSVLNATPVTNPFLIWTLLDICCLFWRYSRKTCRSVLLKFLTFQFQFELYFHFLGRFININFS